jgi:hypothetical protein
VISWEKNEKRRRDGAFLKKKNACFFCRGKILLDDAPSRYI